MDTASSAQTLSGFTLQGVNTFQVQNDSTVGDQEFNLSLATGLSTVSVVNSDPAGATKFSGLKSLVGASISNSIGNVEVGYDASVVTGTADAMSVTLNGAGVAAAAQFKSDGIETINLTSTGTASGDSTNGTRVTIAGANLKTLNISGTAAARLTTTLDGATGTTSANAGVVNASAMTGALNLDISGYTKTTLSVTGGSGNDTIDMGAILGNKMTVAGGTGADTLVLSAAATTGSSGTSANVSGFETVQFKGAVDQDMSAFSTDVTRVNIANNGANTISKAGAQIATLGVTGSGTSPITITSLGMTRATNSTEDSVTVAMGSATSDIASRTLSTLTLNNEESVTITSTGKATGNVNTVTSLVSTELETLTLSGANKLVISGATVPNLDTIDASAMTGAFEMGAAFTNNATTISGGSGNDILRGGSGADTIDTGAGNNTVEAGAGKNSVTGGSGNDIITAGSGNDTIEAGAGNDYITPGAGTDAVDAGDGDDTIAMGGSDFSSADVIDGGAGNNTLNIIGATTLTEALVKRLDNVQQISNISSGALSVTLTDAAMAEVGVTQMKIANYGKDSAGTSTYGSGTTTVDAGALTAENTIAVTITNNTGGAINDNLVGGKGDDSFTFLYRDTKAAALDSADTVTGGAGTDTVTLNGATSGVAIAATFGASVTGIEDVVIGANAGNTTVTTNDANVAAFGTLTVDATAMTTTTATFTFNGAAETDSTASYVVYGGAGNNTITGGAGTDSLVGGLSADSLTGGAGNDTIDGAAGNDSLYGGTGNDLIHNEAGNDRAYGGVGNDTIHAGSGNDVIFGDAGTDSLVAGSGNDTLAYVNLTDSQMGNGTSFTGDTIDGFDFSVDKFALGTSVASVGTLSIGTVNFATMETTLAANSNLTSLLSDANATVLLTIQAGTAAGTYMVIAGAAGSFDSTSDAIIKLVNAENTDSYGTSNFTTELGSSFVVTSGKTFVLNTNTGGITSTETGAPADTAAALVAGYNAIFAATGATTPTVDASAQSSGATTFDFGTGILTGGAGSDVNSLTYTGMTLFKAGAGGSDVTLSAGAQSFTGGTGNDTLRTGAVTAFTGTYDFSAAGTDTVVVNTSGANITRLGSTGLDAVVIDGLSAVTMTVGQNAVISSSSGTNTVSLSDSSTSITAKSAVESYVLGGTGNNTIALTAAAQNVTTAGTVTTQTVSTGSLTSITGTLTGNSAATNVLSVAVDGNISGATLTSLSQWGISLASSVDATMTAAQMARVTAAAGTNTITLTDSSTSLTTVGDADVTLTTLGGSGANTITLADIGTVTTNSQSVTTAETATTQTINTGLDTTVNGTFTGNATATDVLNIVTTNTNIASAVLTAIDQINLVTSGMAATVSIDQNALINTAAGTNSVTLSAAGTTTGAASVETYVLASSGTSLFTLGAFEQNVTGDSAATNGIVFGAGSYTGTITNADTFKVVNGSDISAVNNGTSVGGALAAAGTFASGASVTMTNTQLAGLSGTITATGTQTVTLTDDGGATSGSPLTVAAKAEIENYVLNDKAGKYVTFTFASSAAQSVSGGAGLDTFIANGSDTMTGGTGIDTFQFGDGNARSAGGNVITDFQTGTDLLGLSVVASPVGAVSATGAINSGGTLSGLATGGATIMQAAYSTSQITGALADDGGAGTVEGYLIVFNSSTNRGQIWYDNDWETAGSRVLVSTFDSIDTLAGITGIATSNVSMIT